MRYETLRLIHAQGVPNHYITNQVYVPSDEDHQQRGVFFILIEQTNTKDGAFVAALVNTLIREYYRQPGVELVGDFEHALIRVNNQINQYSQEQLGAYELHGCIVLHCNDEIHFSHIGRPEAFLARDNTIIRLIETDPGREGQDNFSVITSGEMKIGDILALLTPLETSNQAKEDIEFALKQVPLYEAGRAYARILKHKLERNAEGLFLRFNETDENTAAIAVDKPLESLGERMTIYQERLARHGMFVFEGTRFLFEQSKKLPAKLPKRGGAKPAEDAHFWQGQANTPTSADIPPETASNIEDRAFGEGKTDEITTETASEPTAMEASLPQTSETPSAELVTDGPYRVKGYWQSDEAESQLVEPGPTGPKTKNYKEGFQDDAELPTEAPHQSSVATHEHTHHHEEHGDVRVAEVSSSPLSRLAGPRFHLPRRTWYILVGLLVLLVIIIRTVNTISSKSPSTANAPKQSAQERDGLVAQAEAMQRDGEAAQLSDDTAKAITSFSSALEILNKITEANQNEKSRALVNRANQSVKTVTKTTQLETGTKAQTISALPARIITTGNGHYVINNFGIGSGAVQKYSGDAITPIKGAAEGKTVVAGVAFAGNKLALLTKDSLVYSVDTSSGEAKQITRSDSEAWPKSNHIASFDQNLYFVGEAMYKAIPAGDKYSVAQYNKSINTGGITTIVNNIFFYAIDGSHQLVRIDSKSPKNPIAFSGIPDSFLPKTITRILTPFQEGVLHIWDNEGQRVMEFTTDGVYHKQWQLPKEESYTDCDISGTSLVCVNKDKQIKTFALGG